MRALKQDEKDDLFLLEYDQELRNLRIERWKAEKRLQDKIYTERVHLEESVQVEDALEKLISLLKFWKKDDDSSK